MVKILKFLSTVQGTLVTVKVIAEQVEMNELEVLRILKLLRGMNYVAFNKNDLWTITQDGIDRLDRS
jgi:DNA-binding IclR family transcriptional regulator